MTEPSAKVTLRVPASVARFIRPDAPYDIKLAIAHGTMPLGTADLLIALLVFLRGWDEGLRQQAVVTLRELPAGMLLPALRHPETHPQVLDMVLRHRLHELSIMETLLVHPELTDDSLLFAAQHAQGHVLQMISHNQVRLLLCPALVQALIDNPHVDRATKYRLGWREDGGAEADEAAAETAAASARPDAAEDEAEAGKEFSDDDLSAEHLASLAAGDFDPEAMDALDPMSKYQMVQEMAIAEKIKMAMTGDKEWRGLLVKEANKMVSSAVLRNPRVTEQEVFTVAKNRSTAEELVRIILLNREWLKNYEIKKALVAHPRTPLNKAVRMMESLAERDLKTLAKSRDVAQAITNNARRLVFYKSQKK